jgi:hypothetical protein
MATITLYRLAEECMKLLAGGEIPAAAPRTFGEVKTSICQVINKLLKAEIFELNLSAGETIPNGAMIGLYEDIAVTSYGNGKSKATLPIKPMKLPRNMGIFAIYPKFKDTGGYEYDKEFIPLQMGQAGLLKSQPMINNLLGQVGYENYGLEVVFNQDLKLLFPDITLAMRLVIMDVSLYDDWDILPITPEMEWDVKREVVALYMGEKAADRLVDSTGKEQSGTPVKQQQQN